MACRSLQSNYRSRKFAMVFDFYSITFLFFVCLCLNVMICAADLDTFFLENALEQYSDQNKLNLTQLQKFLDAMMNNDIGRKKVASSSHEFIQIPVSDLESDQSPSHCWDTLDVQNLDVTNSSVQSCLLSSCLNASHLLELYNLPSTGTGITASLLLQTLSPALLYQAQSGNCRMETTETPLVDRTPTSEEVWGYGILFVSIINLSSLVGVAVVPFMKKRMYHVVLMFLVSLAVGVLCGSSLLFLIPDALGLNEIEEVKDIYIWKAMAVVGGIYLFFLIERILKIIMDAKEKRSTRRKQNAVKTLKMEKNAELGVSSEQVIAFVRPDCDVTNHEETSLMEMPQIQQNGTADKNGHVEKQGVEDDVEFGQSQQIAPVAWMIIFGDGLHNFIDGLAIGAAFVGSTLAGISISVAVMCEEFPHELGDFAILLKSGMSVKKAVLFNFLSACCCYGGLAIGIVLGAMTTASRWIFAVAGGMFLYISLVDMMPEINHMHAEEGDFQIGKKFAFLIQNLGLLLGFGIMLILAVYGSEIDFTR